MRASWLVSTSSSYFHKARVLRHTSALLKWLIYVFNPVVNTELPAILSHRRSTTVSLETYPFKKKKHRVHCWFT